MKWPLDLRNYNSLAHSVFCALILFLGHPTSTKSTVIKVSPLGTSLNLEKSVR